MIRDYVNKNNEVIELTILEDYSKNVYIKTMSVKGLDNKKEKRKIYKEIIKKNKPSKLTCYKADIRRVREMRGANLDVCKNVCIIRMYDGEIYTVKGSYYDIVDKVYYNENKLINKIGF